MAASCNICCEYYTKSTRAPVKCGFGDCNFEACKSCVRKYLLSITNEPHCMNCKKSWSQNFMTMNLNRSFVSKEYKEKRMNLLLEQEMSKMPQTMEAAKQEKQAENEITEIEKIDYEIMILQKKMNNLNKEKRARRVNIHNLRNHSNGTSKDSRKFIMPCPGNDCRGFLNSQYKCEMCNMHTCSKCLVIIETNKNAEHICDPNMVKSAELIKQETKPCPSCGTRISKISGCDQMWCTNCHVAFNWNSGTIDNGPVHNPHFYEYQKTVNSHGIAPRNPGDVVCGGMCHYMTLRTLISNKISRTEYFTENREQVNNIVNSIYSLHRIGVHISAVSLPYFREQARDIDHNESLRVEYLLKKRTKEELCSTLYQRDYTRQKNKEILYVMELISVSLIEMFSQLITTNSNAPELINEFEQYHSNFKNLAKYCNGQLESIGVSYNRSVPKLVFKENLKCQNKNKFDEWFLADEKYNTYSEKKKKYNNSKSLQAANEN